MSKTHQKKRNTGLLYEFLVKAISSALIEGDKRRSTSVLRVLKRYFKPGTELYREFRLINALAKTTVSSEAIAASIIGDAKAAAREHDLDALDREKSLLIKSINYNLGGDAFYDQQINEYRTYATIQTLLNDWRAKDVDLQRLAMYEDKLLRMLLTEKSEICDTTVSNESNGSTRLLMKVMAKKLNEKYTGVLNEEQRSLMKAYAYAHVSDDMGAVKKKLVEQRDRVLSLIDCTLNDGVENSFLIEKLATVRGKLLSENVDCADDDTVTRFMLYAQLGAELLCKEE